MYFIKFIDGPSGSGKTYGYINKIIDLVTENQKVVVCQTSIRLIEETDQSLRHSGIHIEKIHCDNCTGVIKSLYSYLDAPYPEGHVLFITWEAFDRLEFFSNAKNWHLFVDEIPQGQRAFEEPLAKSHKIITDNLDLGADVSSDYKDLILKNKAATNVLAKNETKDRTYEIFQPLAATLGSKHWRTYVNVDSYNKLLDGELDTKRLSAFSLLQPSIFDNFKSVTVAGANFKESLLYLYWSRIGVQFVEEKDVELRYRTHENVQNLRILWSIEADYSKTLRDRQDKTLLKAMVKALSEKFSDVSFLWSANKDIPDNLFGRELKGIRLPQSPHGLNEYQDIDNVIFLSAHNPTPANGKFLSDVTGVDRDTIRTAIHRQQVYQAIMRGSLRDPGNDREKCVYVPDFGTAEWLKSKFQNAKLEQLSLDMGDMKLPTRGGSKRVHSSGAERTAAHREKKRVQIKSFVELLDEQKIPMFNELCLSISNDGCNETTLLKGPIVTQLFGSLWADIRATTQSKVLTYCNLGDVESIIHALHKRPYISKENNLLLSPSIYAEDPKISTYRAEINIVYTQGVWLDNDCGGMTPEDFAKLFPSLRMTIFSTKSSTKSTLRWRVYIPTTIGMPPETYKSITANLMKKIVEAGYPLQKHIPEDDRKAHGFDPSKMRATDLFYLPCQPLDPSGSYFKIFRGKGRKALVPAEWDTVEEEESLSAFSFDPNRTYRPILVQKAIEIWREKGCLPGNGDRELYLLGLRLTGARCNEAEIVEILKEQAHFAHTAKDRLKQIPDIIKRLKIYGHVLA